MIIDGMTQKTTALPHFQRKPAWCGKDELGVHVIGSIIEDCGIHLEFSYWNVGDNTNVLIDNIHKGIERMHAKRREANEPFPEVLFLQLDNVNHNKSKCLMTYLSYLVETNVFRKVKVNYLMVDTRTKSLIKCFRDIQWLCVTKCVWIWLHSWR